MTTRRSIMTLAIALLVACGDDAPAPTPDAGLPTSTIEGCADGPSVTYANFGEGFMTARCQSCHASTSGNRYGAPASVTFDTRAEVAQWSERILARSTGDAPTMPPGNGMRPEEPELLARWLTCFPDQ